MLLFYWNQFSPGLQFSIYRIPRCHLQFIDGIFQTIQHSHFHHNLLADQYAEYKEFHFMTDMRTWCCIDYRNDHFPQKIQKDAKIMKVRDHERDHKTAIEIRFPGISRNEFMAALFSGGSANGHQSTLTKNGRIVFELLAHNRDIFHSRQSDTLNTLSYRHGIDHQKRSP